MGHSIYVATSSKQKPAKRPGHHPVSSFVLILTS